MGRSSSPEIKSSRRRRENKKSPEKREQSKTHKIKKEPRSVSRSPDRRRNRNNSRDRSQRRKSRDRELELRNPVGASSKWDDKKSGDGFKKEREFNNRKRIDDKRNKSPETQNWGKPEPKKEDEPEEPKEKPNFGISGKLMEDTNKFKGVIVKYNEPPEARKPKIRWRLYPFKGEDALEVMYIHRQSAYLIGRERKIVDIPIDHPSSSKQHAVVQYRAIKYEREDGSQGRTIKPYLIDLASANGTFLNNNKVEPQRYVELREKDVIKFGFSTREFVLLHEGSLQTEEDSNSEEETETNQEIKP